MNWLEALDWNESNLDDIRVVGYSYLKQGHFSFATSCFKALVILNPNSAYDNQTLGSLYLQDKRYMLALEYLDKSISLNPKNYLALLNRTRALLSLGYINQAISQAKALQTCPINKIASQASAIVLAYS
jgi:tetratricopeptide (TPR) repeat protein